MSKISRISEACKNFRINVLKLTLAELSEKSGTNLKTISAYENGNSTNFNHLDIYLNNCTEGQKNLLLNEINNILRK